MSETLRERLNQEIKNAMRAKEALRLGTLRLISAAIKQKEVDERKELNDSDILSIIEKQVKQRKESISAFEQAGRTESAEQEKAEMAVLQEFLPEQASSEEVEAIVKATIAEITVQGISGPAVMGKAMPAIKAKLSGRADMSEVSKLLKNLL